ncbi:MAG: FtsX-like permease family protein [Rikenellaceae bacterium]
MKIILKNFLNTLKSYKASNLLNIIGLALAFASMYILLVQVNWELTYNRSIKDSDRIFAVEAFDDFENNGSYTQYISRPIGEFICTEFPNIENGGTLSNYQKAFLTFKFEDKIENVFVTYVELTIGMLDFFGFENIEGDVKNIINPKTAAIPESMALKYDLHIGDLIYYGEYIDKKKSYDVVAIYKDFQDNTLLGENGVVVNLRRNLESYSEWSYAYYIKLKSSDDAKVMEKLLADKVSKKCADENVDNVKIRLTSINDLYFEIDSSEEGRGNKNNVYMLVAMIIVVLIIALINFVNFFYALVPVRIKKVNTMKIFGSPIFSLRLNFIFEALGLTFISLLIAWYLVYIVQTSSYADYINTSLSLSDNHFVLFVTIAIAFLVALVASVYPAYYITSFPIAFVTKGSFATSKSGQRLRTILLSVQFIIAISLIIASIFMKVQHNFMLKHDMGFNRENMLSLYLSDSITSQNRRAAYVDKLLVNSQIKDVAWMSKDIVVEEGMTWGRDYKGKNIEFQCCPVSSNFLEFMDIEIIEGRDFTGDDNLKPEGALIFNETAQKEFGLVVDDKIYGTIGEAEIIGICKDFNSKPLQQQIIPMALYMYYTAFESQLTHLYIRTTANADIKSVIDYIKTTTVEFDPSKSKEAIEVMFFDEELGKLYYKEDRLSTLITTFSVISIIISLMGVFGLVMFETQYRRKEIGLRRVHGASQREILKMFNRKYIIIVLVCFVIAAPVTYYILSVWVSQFAYHAPISWWIFALALLLVLFITITTVTVRSYKSANEDPVSSIKTE